MHQDTNQHVKYTRLKLVHLANGDINLFWYLDRPCSFISVITTHYGDDDGDASGMQQFERQAYSCFI